MRRMLFALTGLVLALAVSAPAGVRAPAPTTPAVVTATTFLVSGRGWGHGVGMSQYGALGYAQEGWTYDQILAHFYTGAELGPAAVARVRVLVAEAKGGVTVRSAAPFRVRDVFGKTYPLAAGPVALGPKLRVSVNGTPTELAGPLLFLPGRRRSSSIARIAVRSRSASPAGSSTRSTSSGSSSTSRASSRRRCRARGRTRR